MAEIVLKGKTSYRYLELDGQNFTFDTQIKVLKYLIINVFKLSSKQATFTGTTVTFQPHIFTFIKV